MTALVGRTFAEAGRPAGYCLCARIFVHSLVRALGKTGGIIDRIRRHYSGRIGCTAGSTVIRRQGKSSCDRSVRRNLIFSRRKYQGPQIALYRSRCGRSQGVIARGAGQPGAGQSSVCSGISNSDADIIAFRIGHCHTAERRNGSIVVDGTRRREGAAQDWRSVAHGQRKVVTATVDGRLVACLKRARPVSLGQTAESTGNGVAGVVIDHRKTVVESRRITVHLADAEAAAVV